MPLYLYSAPPPAGGSKLADLHRISTGVMTRQIDNNDNIAAEMPWDAPWRNQVKLRRVVRYIDDFGDITDWRVMGIDERIDASNDSIIPLRCRPILLDLADAKPIRDTDAGGRTDYNLGAGNMTAAEYILSFMIPSLAAEGITHWQLGVCEINDRFDLTWDTFTPLQLLRALEAQVKGEIQVRVTPTAYLIDIVERRGSDVDVATLRTDREIIWLERSRRAEPLATVALGRGGVADGDVEAAGIGYTSWKVSAVAGNVATLVSPTSGKGPLLEDEQLDELFLLKTNSDLTEITASYIDGVDHKVEVADASNIAVGDHVEIRADADGTLLDELTSPSAIDEFGRVTGVYTNTDLRGERNHTPNPLLSNWDVSGTDDVLLAQLNGVHTTTGTVHIKGLTAGDVIDATAVLAQTNTFRNVTVGGTADGSGEVTVTIAGTLSGSDGSAITVHRVLPMPVGWSKSSPAIIHKQRDPLVSGSDTGAADGTQSTANPLMVRGLTPDYVIQPADMLLWNGVPFKPVIGRTVVDPSGNAAVYLQVAIGSGTPVADGDVIEVQRPTPTATAGRNGLLIPAHKTDARIISPGITVFATETTPVLWAAAMFDIINANAATLISADDPAFDLYPARLRIMDVATGQPVGFPTDPAEVTDDERSLPANSVTPVILRRQCQISEPTEICLELLTPSPSVDFASWQISTVLRWVMLTIGSASNVPPIEGSHAEKIWQSSNLGLAADAVEPRVMRARFNDLARVNPGLTVQSLVLGQFTRMIGVGTDLDVLVRISALQIDMFEPTNTIVTFESIPPRFSASAARGKVSKLYITLGAGAVVGTGTTETSSTAVDAGTTLTTPTSDSPPVRQPEAKRAIISQGAEPPPEDDPIAHTIERFHKGGLQ